MRRAVRVLSQAILIAAIVMPLSAVSIASAAGELGVFICAGPYALVDSNKPGDEGPMVLTFCVSITNNSGDTCNDIDVYIGDGATPGTFAVGSDASTSLSMPWCATDAHRFIPSLTAGETRVVIWQVAYPPTFDVTYDVTVWAESGDGSCNGTDSHQVTTRSSLTAAANKVLGSVAVNPPGGVVSAGNIVEVAVTGFNFGQVGDGYSDEQDAWLQPIGNLDFNPCCFRLISTEVMIASIDGSPEPPFFAMPYANRLYFPGIKSQNPPPNYAQDAGDYVVYRFIALGDCSTVVQPYQEVASGQVQKYSGDYGNPDASVTLESDGSSIELEKSVSPTTGGVTDTLTWTITYTNTSALPVGDPDSGAALVIIDQGIPGGTVYVAGSADWNVYNCSIYYSTDGGTTWDITEPADPATVNMLKWRITEEIPGAGVGSVEFETTIMSVDESICNSATAQIEGGGVIASTSVCANQPPDVEANKVDALLTDNGDGYVGPGDVLTYTVTISADCEAAAAGVIYNDVLDPNVTLVDDSITTTQGEVTSPNNEGDSSVAVNVGTIAACGAVTITYQVTVNASLPPGVTHIENQGTVTGDNFPAEPTNDPSTEPDDDPTVVLVTSAPDIQVLKTDSVYDDADSNGAPSPGDILTYQIVVTNNGNQDGVATVLIDSMPTYTSLIVGSVVAPVSATIIKGNTAGDTMVDVQLGDIPGNGGSATVTFRVQIDDVVPADIETVSNQAIVTGDNFPPELSDDPDTQTPGDPTETPITAAPVLEVDKRATPGPDVNGDGFLNPNETIVYTISITNSGNQEAGSVVFEDFPDSNTTLIVGSVATSQGTVTTGNTAGDGHVVVDIGTILVGPANQVEISFVVTVDSDSPSLISNQGTASGGNFPEEPSDDPRTPADDDPTVSPVLVEVGEPLIEAYKTDILVDDVDGSGGLSVGDIVEYIVTITNDGTGAASNAVFTDTPDANTSLVVGSVDTSLGTITEGNDGGDTSVAVTIGTLEVGVEITIHFRVVLEAGVYSEISNQGLVEWGTLAVEDEATDDPYTATDDDPTVSLLGAPSIEASKADALIEDADASGDVSAGDTIRYTVTISNSGTGAAENVSFTDTPDANTSLVVGSVDTSLGSVVSGNGAGDSSVQVDIGTIDTGVTVTIHFDVLLLEGDYTLITNQGSVEHDAGEPRLTDDPATTTADDPTDTLVYANEPSPPVVPRAVGGEAMRPDKAGIVAGMLLMFGTLIGLPLLLRRSLSAR